MQDNTAEENIARSETPTLSADKPEESYGYGMFRNLVESVLSLVIAVMLFRTFLVDSYMISTGSMAPHLLGYHKRVTCPSCQYEFSVGIEFDKNVAQKNAAAQEETNNTQHTAFCPNCGLHSIPLSNVPRSQGDQILVNRTTFHTRLPIRWEVVVFRNPENTTQPYVKRVIGLPGETVSTKYGDIYSNDQLVRKSPSEQQALRLLVYDHDFEPKGDPSWKSRWVPNIEPSRWKREGSGFKNESASSEWNAHSVDWLVYRHWVREGGHHITNMPIPKNIAKSQLESPSLYPLSYDFQTGTLSCRGAMSEKSRDRLLKMFDDGEFRREVGKLYEKSHVGIIGDGYAYNSRVNRMERIPVSDLMINCRVAFGDGSGRFLLQMGNGDNIVTLQIIPSTRTVELWIEGNSGPVKSVTLKPDVFEKPLNLEMSLFDRQVVVLLNDQLIFSPQLLSEEVRELQLPKNPVRMAVENLSLRVDSMKLFRDVYYTEKGPHTTYTLGPDEFFMMGDNSPVSADSRVWSKPGVHRRLLLGKPFVVHLPSKPSGFRIGGRTVRYRVPDFARIRYIR